MPVLADDMEDDYLDIASNYCIIGDYDAAIRYLDKILEMNPDNRRVSTLRAGLTHIMKNDKKTYVTNVNPYIKEAMEYKRLGDEKHELEALIAGTQSQNSYLALYYLGNFYKEKGDNSKAIDYFNQSLSARGDFAQAYLSLAITLFDMGKYESALNPIDKYLTYNESDDFAYAIKSRAEFQLGMLEASKADNDIAISLNDCPEYQFDRAKILYKYGDYAQSKELFESLLSNIQTSKIYEYLGYCYYELGDYMNALINIDRAFILSDDDQYLNNKYNEIRQLLEQENG